MNVTTAIETRRAVKAFDPDHKMTEAEIERLLSFAILPPTAFNIQNWRFVLVRDPALRQEIRKVAWDQAQVTVAGGLRRAHCRAARGARSDEGRRAHQSLTEIGKTRGRSLLTKSDDMLPRKKGTQAI